MRLRVKVDVRLPLKKEGKVKRAGGEWCVVQYKYERLGIIYFFCGCLGHIEQDCAVRFTMESDNGGRS